MRTRTVSSTIKEKIKEYFFNNPTAKLRVRQIERILKLSLPSIIRYTKTLEKEGFLAVNNISGVRFYTANRSSKTFVLEKRLYNIKQLFDSGLADFLIKEFSNPTIIAFGSYAKGEDVENSDIDLYIESPKKQEPDFKRFEKVLERKIQVFIFSDIHKIPNPELSNNIINGVLLNGYLEVFK